MYICEITLVRNPNTYANELVNNNSLGFPYVV